VEGRARIGETGAKDYTKQEQGKQEMAMMTPLMAKKTDRRAGVIVNASEKKVKSVNFNGTPPTRVFLLRQQVQ
jgi:splicing factor 45